MRISDWSSDVCSSDLFVGLNLHKWIGAPLGVGALYIRREKVDLIDPDIANAPPFGANAHARIHTGTVDFAAQLSVPAALDCQDAIGDEARAARHHYLRALWAEPLRDARRRETLQPSPSHRQEDQKQD